MTQPTELPEGGITRLKDGVWDVGLAGTCQCGWVGPKCERYGECLKDINDHNTTHAQASTRREEVVE